MRFGIKVTAALVVSVAALTPANALPYDPYPWCAQYYEGASNCGFSTIEQCRATVSGNLGFCVPNQFYNPGQVSAVRTKKPRY
jgi:hypothetical protein